MARGFGAIPVERPQDLAAPGKGEVVFLTETHIKGEGTAFDKEVHVGDTIRIEGIPNQIVERIVSAEEMYLKAPGVKSHEMDKRYAYKILPKVDQSGVYSEVWSHLRDGGCIGIFPEGGSHDRSDLLPLKAGVALMALGAMHKYNVPVSIVACGLKYFKPHKFRSQVIVEFGKPYTVPLSLRTTFLFLDPT